MNQKIPVQVSESNQNDKIYRCVSYLRVSTEDQVEHYWLDMQKKAIESYVASGMSLEFLEGVDYEYRDEWVSWTKPYFVRNWLNSLFQFHAEWRNNVKPFDAIVVYKLDRLARSLKVLLEIVEKCKKENIAIISVSEHIDTSSTFGSAMLSIMGVFAELEKNMIRDRMKAWRIMAIENWTRQAEVYGYRRNTNKRPEIYEPEAEIVRDIFEGYAHWKSLSSIAKDLEARNVERPEISMKKDLKTWKNATKKLTKDRKNKKTGDYQRWTTKIANILRNYDYIWMHYYDKSEFRQDERKNKSFQDKVDKDKWILSKFEHTPIVSNDIFYKAQKKLEEPSARKTAKIPYLLTGLLKCDCCREQSTQWIIWWRASPAWNKRYYWCSAKNKHKDKNKNKYFHHCPTVTIPADDIEALVTEHIRNIIKDPNALDKYLNTDEFPKNRRDEILRRIDGINKDNERIERAIENINAMSEEWVIDYKTIWVKKILNHRNEKDKNNNKIKQLKESLNNVDWIESYRIALSKIRENYFNTADNFLDNKEKIGELIGYLVKEIIVYSRPRKESDVIRWPRSSAQYIPYRIRIILNLPQEFIDAMMYVSPNPSSDWWDYDNWNNWLEKNTSVWDVKTEKNNKDLFGINKISS